MKPEQINFVIVSLCDNDYGHDLVEGIRALIEARGINFCPFVAKKFLVEYISSASVRSHLLRSPIIHPTEIETYRKATMDYLDQLTVEKRQRLPTYEDGSPVDHDGGSAYYDVNLDQIFRF